MRRKALQGIRVLDCTDGYTAYCAKLLGDLGADVLKVERLGGGKARGVGPFLHGKPGPERSLSFKYLNTSKRGITLDVAKKDGQELFRRLAVSRDVVVEDFAPGYLDKMGLGFEALSAVEPKLVVVSITGFGQSGPYKDFKSDEMIAMAMGGLMHSSGLPHRPPVRSLAPVVTYLASMHAAQGVLMALRVRSRTGTGQHVDISLQETAATTLTDFGVNSYTGWRHQYLTRWYGGDRSKSLPFGNYPAKDGFVSLIITRPAHWTAFVQWFVEVTGNGDILDEKYEGDRTQFAKTLRPMLEDFTRRFTKKEFYAEARKRHLTFVPVSTMREVAEHAQLEARGYFAGVEHAELKESFRYPGAPYQLKKTPWGISRRAPLVGEDNDEVYGKELGLGEKELAALKGAGVI